MEDNRKWNLDWKDLSVTVQKCITFRSSWAHPCGFQETTFKHIPYDTLRILVRDQYGVVISAQLGLRTVQAVLYKIIRPSAKLIIWTCLSEVTEDGESAFRRFGRKLLLRFADAVLANGSSAVRYLTSLGAPPSRLLVFSYYPEISHLSCLPACREGQVGHRLLFVGQLIERKGMEKFLPILAEWFADRSNQLGEIWIVGEGPRRLRLEQIEHPNNLTVRFHGHVPPEQLGHFYGECGILAFPTLADEWGVVVNEALAAGMPVLGSLYSQAVEEMVKDGVNGWTFRPDSPEEVRRSISCALTASIEELNSMRRASREVAQHYSPEKGAKKLIAALRFVEDSNTQSGAGFSPEEVQVP
jgi:glycosyltransferase involved in cell wall biosynthesis